jgi:xylulokinase
MIADIMGRKVRTLDVPDAAILGAAGLAAIGAGLYADAQEVVAKMVRFGDTYEPIPANVAVYDQTFAAYKAAYAGLKSTDVFTQLAALRPE